MRSRSSLSGGSRWSSNAFLPTSSRLVRALLGPRGVPRVRHILIVAGRVVFRPWRHANGTQGKSGTRARLRGAKEAGEVLARGARLVPKEGLASPMHLQGVPEPKAGKNRMHLDIVVDDIEAEIHRLQALGARRIDEGVQSFGGTRWVRMSDPEQNEFCVSTGVEW